MRVVSLFSRYLLGTIFLIFGLNLFLHFLHMPTPGGTVGEFFAVLAVSHYIDAVAAFQVVPAILLLVNCFVPLGLAILAPVIVNILLTHFLMDPSGIPLALLVSILWILAVIPVRSAFWPLFQFRVRS